MPGLPRNRHQRGFITIYDSRTVVTPQDAPPVAMQCPKCLKDTTIVGMNSTQWATFFFIRVFKVSGEQSICQCSACKRRFDIDIVKLAAQSKNRQRVSLADSEMESLPGQGLISDPKLVAAVAIVFLVIAILVIVIHFKSGGSHPEPRHKSPDDTNAEHVKDEPARLSTAQTQKEQVAQAEVHKSAVPSPETATPKPVPVASTATPATPVIPAPSVAPATPPHEVPVGAAQQEMQVLAELLNWESAANEPILSAKSALQAAGGLDLANLKTKDDVVQRLALIKKMADANEQFDGAYRDFSKQISMALAKTHLDDATKKADTASMTKILPLLHQMCDSNRHLTAASSGMLNLLLTQWGKWKVADGQAHFDSPDDLSKYAAFVKEIQAASASQEKLKTKL